jgi:hypothetical protein
MLLHPIGGALPIPEIPSVTEVPTGKKGSFSDKEKKKSSAVKKVNVSHLYTTCVLRPDVYYCSSIYIFLYICIHHVFIVLVDYNIIFTYIYISLRARVKALYQVPRRKVRKRGRRKQ